VKIADVRVLMFSAPIPPERQHRTDLGQAVKAEAAVVEVRTNEGLRGIGPAFGPPPVIQAIVETELKDLILGQDPCAAEWLWERMYAGSRADLSRGTGYSFPRVSRRGETLAVMSGIDIACWDISGQAAGMPVCRLLGGGLRDRVPGYASGGWRPADRIGEEVKGFAGQGFRAVKMRVWGEHGFTLQEAISRIEAARAALGESVDLMVDAHGALGLPEATALAERIAPCRIRWFEEPVSPDDHAGYRHLRARTTIPLAAGENEVTRYPFVSLLVGRWGLGHPSARRGGRGRSHGGSPSGDVGACPPPALHSPCVAFRPDRGGKPPTRRSGAELSDFRSADVAEPVDLGADHAALRSA
jgi:D-galactarolactone cycloisomerase